jgi:crossover junction endodeoxyribonuclease RuvC
MSGAILGMDPGLDGALAVYWPDGLVEVLDIPTVGKKTKRCVDPYPIADWIAARDPILAVIEKVSAMKGWGVGGVFRFGDSAGVLRGVVASARIPIERPTPQVWKRHFDLIGQDKEASRQKAINLCPKSAHLFSRVMDHQRADALLMARWGADLLRKRGTV